MLNKVSTSFRYVVAMGNLFSDSDSSNATALVVFNPGPIITVIHSFGQSGPGLVYKFYFLYCQVNQQFIFLVTLMIDLG